MAKKRTNLSLKLSNFPSIVSLPLRERANSDILIILSLLLPLPSPPISSRANSKLICNSHWRRNWCLILVLGNRIIQLMREWWKKIRGRERGRKKGQFYMKNYFVLLLFSRGKIIIKLSAWCKILRWEERIVYVVSCSKCNCRTTFFCHCSTLTSTKQWTYSRLWNGRLRFVCFVILYKKWWRNKNIILNYFEPTFFFFLQ